MKNSYNRPDPRELRAANDDSYLQPELKASRQRAYYSGSDPREIRAARDDSWRLPPFIPRN
jgi:hypothetical protein